MYTDISLQKKDTGDYGDDPDDFEKPYRYSDQDWNYNRSLNYGEYRDIEEHFSTPRA